MNLIKSISNSVFNNKPVEYIAGYPSAQKILDIYEGRWASRLPAKYKLKTSPGHSDLFEDERITWLKSCLQGGFTNLDILELGPLEGGHSYMLEQGGAKKVEAIEANTLAFQKCLVIKEILGLKKTNFLLGDFNSYLEDTTKQFDLLLACGVLYHMENPLKLLSLMTKVSKQIFLWTHYYDKEMIQSKFQNFSKALTLEYQGHKYHGAKQQYGKYFKKRRFYGGATKESLWLTRQSIFDFLENQNYANIISHFDDKNHPNGPAIALYCSKS